MLRKVRAKRIAKILLETLRVQKSPVDLNKVIKQLPKLEMEQVKGLNIKVLPQDFPNELDDISAILLKEKGQAVIAVNSKHSKSRQRFSVAHELGHLFLHSNSELLTVEKQLFTRADGVHNLTEMEANEFAAELLMPEALIKEDFTKYFKKDEDTIITVLAEKYEVSQAALAYRLTNLNLLN